MRELLSALTREPLLNIALAAMLTWLAHSSVVVVLAVMALAGSGLLGPEATLAMVLGANIGSAVNPVLAGTGGEAQAAARQPRDAARRRADCPPVPRADRWEQPSSPSEWECGTLQHLLCKV